MTAPIHTVTFLSGPVEGPSHHFATEVALLGNVWHKGQLVAPASLTDNKTDDFGLQSGGDFTVEITDPDSSEAPRVEVSDFMLPLLSTIDQVRGPGPQSFDRNFPAYVPDFEGLLKLAVPQEARFRGARRVENLLLATEEMHNATYWNVSNGVTATDVGGGATRLTADGTFDPYYGQIAFAREPVAGRTFRYTVEVKTDAATSGLALFIYDGAVTDIGSTPFETPDNLWHRYSFLFTFGNGTTQDYVIARIDLQNAAAPGDWIETRHPHLEEVTGQSNQNPSDYISNGPGNGLIFPFHGAGVNGVKYYETYNGNTVQPLTLIVLATPGNTPIPKALLRGYRCEPEAENLLLHSGDYSEAVWVPTGLNAPTRFLGPDGRLSAWLLQEDGTNGLHLVDQLISKAAAELPFLYVVPVHRGGTLTKCFLQLYAAGAGVSAIFDLDLGTVDNVSLFGSGFADPQAGVIDLKDDWKLVWVCATTNNSPGLTATFALTDNGGSIGWQGNGTYGVYVGVSTLIQGTQPVMPILTDAATVTKPADQLVFPKGGTIDSVEGTAYAEFEPANWQGATGLVVLGDTAGGGSPLYADYENSGAGVTDGFNEATGVVGNATGQVRAATMWSEDGMRAVCDGGLGAPSAFNGAITLTALGIGHNNTAANFCGEIKNVKTFLRRLEDEDAMALDAELEDLRLHNYLRLVESWSNSDCLLTQRQTISRPNEADEVIDQVRQAKVKSIAREKNKFIVGFAAVDRKALLKPYPFAMYTVEDFPNIFPEHVGIRAPDGVGTVLHCPMAWLDNAGPHVYGGPIARGGFAGTLLNVYRNGALVDPAEYTQSATTPSSGVTINTVEFANEQLDLSGQPYEITADYLLPGSRLPVVEAAYVASQYDVTLDAASVDDAADYDDAEGIFIDRLDGGDADGKQGLSIIQELLWVARCRLLEGANGELIVVQDRPRDATRSFDARDSLMEITRWEPLPERPSAVQLKYRPLRSAGDDTSKTMERPCNGVSETRTFENRYVQDHEVADKLLSYWQQRFDSLVKLNATFLFTKIENGEVITITDPLSFSGHRKFAAWSVARGEISNSAEMEGYNLVTYSYVPTVLPEDATPGYHPDFSKTPPAKPGDPTVVSQDTSINEDGTETAYAVLQLAAADVPAVNVAKVFAALINTSNGNQRIVELLLDGGDYKLQVDNLMPNRTHEFTVYCENAFALKGEGSDVVSFTSAQFTTTPATPTGVGISQNSATQVRLIWDNATAANVDDHIVFRQVNGGSFTEVHRSGLANQYVDQNVSVGNTYGYKVRAVDRDENESSDSGVASQAIAKWIDDGNIIAQGLGTPSLLNSGVTQDKTKIAGFSDSGSISAGAIAEVWSSSQQQVFFPSIRTSGTRLPLYTKQTNIVNTAGVAIKNDTGGSVNYDVAGFFIQV